MYRSVLALAAVLALQATAFEAGATATCTAGNPGAGATIETTPTAAFVDHGDGTVTHSLTGLMWKKCSQGQAGAGCTGGTPAAMHWSAALAAAVADTTAGYSDWRLPNKNELQSIVETCGYLAAINQTLFPSTGGYNYWSGSSYAHDPSSAWIVNFYDGRAGAGDKASGNLFVRLVRGGQPFDSFDARGFTPSPFSFTAQTGVALATVTTSNTITVAGIVNTVAGISINGGSYAINGGSYTTAPGTVSNGDTVTLQQTSSASYVTTTTAILSIGLRSAPFNVTTDKAPTTATLLSTPNPSIFGANISFNITINRANATGTVDLRDGATTIPGCAAAPVLNGLWQCSITSLTAGTHSITGIYSGDINNFGSTSNTVQHIVNKADQQISFAPLADRLFGSPPFTVSATATSGLSVSFSTSGTCTVSGNTVTMIAPGLCTVQASQDGNANWNAAADVDRSFTVLQAAITISPPTLPGGTVGAAYATQNLVASGGAAAPYSYAVTAGSLPSGLTLSGAGTLSGTPGIVGSFAFTVTATDSASAGIGGPFTGSQAYAITVIKGSQTISFGALSDRPLNSAPFPVSATATSGLPVHFTTSGGCTVSGNIVTVVAVGTCTVRASQAGDANWNAAPNVDQSFTVLSPPIVLTITKNGTGSGAVTSNPPGIDCGIDCTEQYASTTAVTLTGAPAAGSVFMGWLGACIGTVPCNLNVSTAATVSATFAPDTVLPRIDIDGNNTYDALTDGLLLIRYLFGLTGPALTSGAIGSGSTRTDPVVIAQQMDNIRPLLDVDGNGEADALTDGLLILRYMFGLRGSALIAGAIDPLGTRKTATEIETYIQSLMP